MAAHKKCVYLDYNATTPLEPEVLAAIHWALDNAWANPSSLHEAGINARAIINQSRKSVADMLGASTSDVIFTSGGTESNNMALHTALRHFQKTFLRDGSKDHVPRHNIRPHIITSNLEHDSIKLVLRGMEDDGLADVTYVAASRLSGFVEPEDVVAAIRPTTILVSIMAANNETGIVQPIARISKCIHSVKRNKSFETEKIYVHSDAAQAIGKMVVKVNDLGVDYLTIVGHKFYGPRIGALYVRDLLEGTPLYQLLHGGGQEKGFRPGTENTGLIAGLGKAAELVTANIDTYIGHMLTVRGYLEKRLAEVFKDKVQINGIFKGGRRLPDTCNFSILGPGLNGPLVLEKVKYIQASVGSACHSGVRQRASPVLLAIGVPVEVAENAMRFSVGRRTSAAEIDIAVDDLECVVKALGTVRT